MRRSVWGLVSGSAGRHWPSRRSVAAAATSRTIAPIRWRVLRLPREFGKAYAASVGRIAGGAEPREVLVEGDRRGRASVDLAEPGLRLGVADDEVTVAQAQVAELARADAAAAPNQEPLASVLGPV